MEIESVVSRVKGGHKCQNNAPKWEFRCKKGVRLPASAHFLGEEEGNDHAYLLLRKHVRDPSQPPGALPHPTPPVNTPGPRASEKCRKSC